MINYIWNFLIIVGIIISIITGNFENLGNVLLSSTNDAFNIFFKISLLILFWSGIFNIAVESGLIKNLTRVLSKPLKFLFPELPKDSLALEFICSNLIANLLGLGAAATPLGLKAFEELQKINKKETPSRSMVTFIILNTCSFSLFPTTIIGLRKAYGGSSDFSLIALMILATFFSTLAGVILDRLVYRISISRKKK